MPRKYVSLAAFGITNTRSSETPIETSARRVTAETQSTAAAPRKHARSISPSFACKVGLSANPGLEYAISQEGSAFTSKTVGTPFAPRIAGIPPQGSRNTISSKEPASLRA